jgi:predicted glutamine amidotransferase
LQSAGQPDGVGLGTFDADGRPAIWRKPVPALRSQTFIANAHEVRSRTFVSHIRHATAGEPTLENTHPFEQHGRLFAHNGVLGDLAALRRRLGEHLELAQGTTDSELFFTLITKRIEEHGGDVGSGIVAAANELASEVPLYSLNFVLTTATDLWALRYPDTNELWILERSIGNIDPGGGFDERSLSGIMRVMSAELAVLPATVIASERLDSSARWRMLEPGELIHVDPDLRVSSAIVVPGPPAQLMDLSAQEAVAQRSD